MRNRESDLLKKINRLQSQLDQVETEISQKYESTITKLERKLKSETKLHDDSKKKYKSLIKTAGDFQKSLKDLQKAVRGKKYNISSYKKIFEEKSKELSNELLKYKNKIITSTNYSVQKDFYNTHLNAFGKRALTPERSDQKSRARSEIRAAPTNLNRVYYANETTEKDEELQKL